jgi:MFS family permease
MQTGLVIISLGYANFWIVPFSDVFGRRPATLICALIALVASIWQAVATSYNSLLGARFVSGLGAAANESLMVIVIADVFFLHERGSWMGVYLYCFPKACCQVGS